MSTPHRLFSLPLGRVGLALLVLLPLRAWGEPPPNTAAAAMGAVGAFLPAAPPSAEALDGTRPLPLWDITQPSAAVHQALQAACAGLVAGQADAYLDLLDQDYHQPLSQGKEIDRTETSRRLRALLARNRCAQADFGLTACQRTAEDRMTVTVRQRLEFFSRDTPPTQIKEPNGQVALVNQTSHETVTLISRQEWIKRGDAWRLRRSETLQWQRVAVL